MPGSNLGESSISAASNTTSYFMPHWGAAFLGVNHPLNQGRWAPADAPENSSVVFYMTEPGECVGPACLLRQYSIALSMCSLEHYSIFSSRVLPLACGLLIEPRSAPHTTAF